MLRISLVVYLYNLFFPLTPNIEDGKMEMITLKVLLFTADTEF